MKYEYGALVEMIMTNGIQKDFDTENGTVLLSWRQCF